MSEHKPLPAFAAYSGASRPKILFIAEAWGESEAQARLPLVGASGQEFWRMLGEAQPELAPELHAKASQGMRYGLAWARQRGDWMEEAGIGFTNVLNLQPPGNRIEALCLSKKELPGDYKASPISQGKFLHSQYMPELARLFEEIKLLQPNLIICLGNTASWAILQATNIGSIRGTISAARAPEIFGLKTLPTYHPAGVLRNWSWRPIVCMDLAKAFREGEFPEIRRPERQVLVSPSISEAEAWVQSTLSGPAPKYLACDIETESKQIKCVGFGRSPSEAVVIPFAFCGGAGPSYWPTASDERRAWECVRALLESPIPKVFQNGMYDLQYLLRVGLAPRALLEDTMLLHHSLWPEMNKGLGFLGSIYTSENSWKLMNRQKADTEKRDE